jgi:L-rhamnonate dehydratase
MKITDIKCITLRLPNKLDIADSSRDTVIIKVFTDEGIIGIGEADTHPEIAKAIINASWSHGDSHGIKDCIIGEDPFDVQKIWDKVYRKTAHYGRRGILIEVLGGIDIALWDIMGKATGKPIYKLLGGSFRNKVQAYVSTLFPYSKKEDVMKKTETFVEKGFKAIKFGWGIFGKEFKEDIELVRAIRDLVGDDIYLMVDGGECMNASEAIKRAKALEEFNVYWFEDPLLLDDLNGYAKLTKESPVKIALGEAETTHYPFERLINLGIDIIQPDISRVGGISECMKIIQMADDKGVLPVIHLWKTGISIAAALHVLAAMKQDSFLEFCITDSPLLNDLTVEKFDIDKEGMVCVPNKPGLGIELNDEIVEKYAF